MHFPFLTGSRVSPKAKHLQLGSDGEGLAALYLQSIGYDVRHRNVRQGHDEIDIIAHDPEDDVLVFVEVKTRTKKTQNGFVPEKTASQKKRYILRRAVRRWVAEHGYDGGYRIDLVCVQEGRITNHFKELAWD
jgi:putative endonuclease